MFSNISNFSDYAEIQSDVPVTEAIVQNVIRIGAPLAFPYTEECIYENPPCPNCKKNQICGGFMFKVIKYIVAPMLNATPIFIRAEGYNVAEGVNSVFSLLSREVTDMTNGPDYTMNMERTLIAEPAYPIMYNRFSAFVAMPRDVPKPLITWVGIHVGFVILFLGSIFIMLCLIRRLSERSPRVSDVLSFFKVLPYVSFWVMISVALSYVGSAVTIALYLPEEPVLPFKTFHEMADKVLAGKLRLMVDYHVTYDHLFKGRDNDKPATMLQQKFLDIHLSENKAKVNPIDESVAQVGSSTDSVLLSSFPADITYINQHYCNDVFEIKDEYNELPTVISSFFFSRKYRRHHNSRHGLLNWYQRQIIRDAYNIYLKWYSATNNDCGLKPKKKRRRAPMELTQIQIVFYAFAGVMVGCIGYFFVENLYHRKVTRPDKRVEDYNFA